MKLRSTSDETERRVLSLLLVEDSEDDAFFFERMLRKSGVRCDLKRAANGLEAVEILEKGADRKVSENLPEIIFLDLKMPGLNGFEVLTWMKRKSLPPKVKVVVLSGSDDLDDRARAEELGASEYLVKPITPAAFNAVLDAVLEN